MPATSAIIKQFGVPPGIDMDKDLRGAQHDETTTDNGSNPSEYEASSTSESHEQVHPALCSFLAPPVASRRTALQAMGQQVLGNITLPAAAAGGRKKAKGRPAKRNASPVKPVKQQPVNQPAPKQSISEPPVVAVARASSPKRMPVVPKALPTKVPQALPTKESESFLPKKVVNCASFNIDLKCSLDPSLPAKKYPLFETDPDGPSHTFDPCCPLKKRVPEFLLEDPVYVLGGW